MNVHNSEIHDILDDTIGVYSKNKDNINQPKHYKVGALECIDVMIKTQGVEAVKSFCICNSLKYIFRHKNKNGIEDIKKAKWYIDKYIELTELTDRKRI